MLNRAKTLGSGLTDKLYWRPINGTFHCFKRLREADQKPGEKFISLCHNHFLPQSGGGQCCRPPAYLRCGMCDGREMDRRGADESMPETANWVNLRRFL